MSGVKSVVVVEPDIDPALHSNLEGIPARKRAERIRRLASIGLLLEGGAQTGALEIKPHTRASAPAAREEETTPDEPVARISESPKASPHVNEAFASAFGGMSVGIVK